MKIKNIILGFGIVFGLWAVVAMVSGLITAGGPVALIGSYMTAVGMTTTFATLVEYYTYIKGIEYLICIAFFVAFPVFFNYVNTEKKEKVKITA